MAQPNVASISFAPKNVFELAKQLLPLVRERADPGTEISEGWGDDSYDLDIIVGNSPFTISVRQTG